MRVSTKTIGNSTVAVSVRRHGFTFVETVIAMALVSFLVTGACSLLISGYSTMRRTRETLYVNQLLESGLEMTRNLSFSEILDQAAKSPVTFSTESPLIPLYDKINGSVATTDYDEKLANSTGNIYFQELSPTLYKVTVAISYQPYRRPQATRTAVIYIAEKGVNRQ